jgi:YHS domain-containing protein
MRSFFSVGSVAVLVALWVGCGGSSSASESGSSEGTASASTTGSETAAARVVPPGEATVGDTTTCPVSGETFVVTAESPRVEHEGRTYYFCCPGCDARFQANPAQFLGAQPAAETSAASAS